MRGARLTCALAAASLAGGCGTVAHLTRASTTGQPAHAAAEQVDRSGHSRTISPARAAAEYAALYAKYLDGRLPAAVLPALGSATLSELGPVIPRRARKGELAVQQVKRTPSGSTFSVELRDRIHVFGVQLTVGWTNARWAVSNVVAPDVDTILHSRTIPIPQPSRSVAAQRAARAFMSGYLRWLYGAGPLRANRDATSRLVARLNAHRPNVPPTFRGLHARLDSLGMQLAGSGWRAFALVTDPRATYDLVASIKLSAGRWLVTDVGAAS
jgi:hypothetical protein